MITATTSFITTSHYYTGHENKSVHHLTFLNLSKFLIQRGRYYIIHIFDISY